VARGRSPGLRCPPMALRAWARRSSAKVDGSFQGPPAIPGRARSREFSRVCNFFDGTKTEVSTMDAHTITGAAELLRRDRRGIQVALRDVVNRQAMATVRDVLVLALIERP
jgi:hypothetical protein